MDIKELVRSTVNAEIVKSRQFIIAANWKMNKNMKEVFLFIDKLKKRYIGKKRNSIILFPPYPYVMLTQELLKNTDISYGLQNIHWESSGAFTGEVSPLMARDLGCQYAIIGHSERRNIFFENDEMINKKIKAALAEGIIPVLCLGEDMEARRENRHRDIIRKQLYEGMADADISLQNRIIIAYEPVWAIGSGATAASNQIEEMHGYINSLLCELYGSDIASGIPVLYGGSVNPGNIQDLAVVKNVSGFLIGGASLKVKDFLKIIELLE